MSKHTPGPWTRPTWERCGIHGKGGTSSDNAKVAHVNINSLDYEANAALIAAAPEMLEALKNLLSYAEDAADANDERPISISAAHACIARAEGRDARAP